MPPAIADAATEEPLLDDQSGDAGDVGGSDLGTAPPEVQSDVHGDVGDVGDAGGAGDVVAEDPWLQASAILSGAGLSGFDSPVEAAQKMVEAIRRRDEQIETYASQIRYGQQGQQNQYQQREQSAPPASESPAQPVNDISRIAGGWVEFPESINRWIEDGEWKPNAPQEVKERLVAYENQREQWAEVLGDPRRLVKALEQHFEGMVTSKLDTTWDERSRSTREEQAVEGFITQNAQWLYEVDPATGRGMVDPVTRQRVISRDGRMFQGFVEQAKKIGIQSPTDWIEYAEMKLRNSTQQREQAPAVRRETAQPAVAEHRRAMQGRQNTSPASPREFQGVSPETGADSAGSRAKSLGAQFMDAMRSG